ncbi:Rid family detoxifying hydrolase [Arsenicibacter rosenii]|uniref:Reactive intermediate/imine deaminase n=1 Tax=Arsenicibacter rosenii TaxID=1750698 RepID=A0A1S2VCR9_9BACT|nr:Rid family detoxifying hydrolase [Arsenicibacter rosenii]OIN56531.1 hypothetical protein BLX24_23970 [Arsenicibacter rosenii]
MKRILFTLFACSLALAGYAQTSSTPPATPPYTDAVEASGLLFVSGQIGRLNGQLVTDSFEAEAHQVMKNVEQILKKRGLSCNDLVNVTIYLTDMRNYGKINDVYRTYFTGQKPLPARVCVAVKELPFNANVEIAGVAAMAK